MKISPSICTGGYAEVAQTLRWLEDMGADRIHIDIMDGCYVKSIMGGVDYVNMIRRETRLPIELHFMCCKPEQFIEMYQIREGELICIHADSTNHPHRLLQSIRAKGGRTALVLAVEDKPEDSVELIAELDEIILMGVQTGCPGVEFQRSVFDKIKKIRRISAEMSKSILLTVDGSVSPENIRELVLSGADSVVLGYPGCFDPVHGREHTLSLMLRLIREAELELREAGK